MNTNTIPAVTENRPPQPFDTAETSPHEVSDQVKQLVAAKIANQEGIKDEIEVICEMMRQDLDYAWSWHCNIAMAFCDEGGDRNIANHAAARFLSTLAGVDTTKHFGFAPFMQA